MILVTGATGFLGKRVCRRLKAMGMEFQPTSKSLGCDLRNESEVFDLFESVRPKVVLNCAAFVGGIQFGYKHPVELYQNNLKMSLHLLEAAHRYGVKRLINPISNCAYPGRATLFKEEEFWNGPLHESVMVYGFVRKAFWVGSWAYYQQYQTDVINLILSNMYGPEDHFEEERSHALGALIMKMVKARDEGLPSVTVWGTGSPVREWLYVDDGAEAMIRAIDIPPYLDPINVGVAKGISVKDLAELIKKKVSYGGQLVFDSSKPDGAPYKTVEGSKGEALLKWRPEVDLNQGIEETVKWYEERNLN